MMFASRQNSTGHVNVQSCLLIIFWYQLVSLQYSWLSVEQPIRFWLGVEYASLGISNTIEDNSNVNMPYCGFIHFSRRAINDHHYVSIWDCKTTILGSHQRMQPQPCTQSYWEMSLTWQWWFSCSVSLLHTASQTDMILEGYLSKCDIPYCSGISESTHIEQICKWKK